MKPNKDDVLRVVKRWHSCNDSYHYTEQMYSMMADEVICLFNEKPGVEPTYPCADCGCPRTKAEGGAIFTVCDKCWDKHYKKKPEVEWERKLQSSWDANDGSFHISRIKDFIHTLLKEMYEDCWGAGASTWENIKRKYGI